jgi:hypothetical protein
MKILTTITLALFIVWLITITEIAREKAKAEENKTQAKTQYDCGWPKPMYKKER